MIRDGAKLVETAQEVVDELAPMLGQLRASLPADPAVQPPPAAARVGAMSEDADYRRLHAALGYDPVGIDALAERTGLTVPALSSMLLRMELEGEVVANPGGTYSRCAG